MAGQSLNRPWGGEPASILGITLAVSLNRPWGGEQERWYKVCERVSLNRPWGGEPPGPESRRRNTSLNRPWGGELHPDQHERRGQSLNRPWGGELHNLPPYSPDYNPIEPVFAKLKALLRKAAARTIDTLWSAIGTLLERFPPAECERYIRHCGYGRSE